MMNKRKIDKLIQQAYHKMEEKEIDNPKYETDKSQPLKIKLVNEGKLSKVCRSHIASLGAAIATGSLLAAVSNFIGESDNEGAKDKKGKILSDIMWELLIHNYDDVREKQGYKDNSKGKKYNSLFDYLNSFNYVDSEDDYRKVMQIRNYIKEIAVAMKMAMNFFELVDDKKESKRDGD